jgi:hypothetical protein
MAQKRETRRQRKIQSALRRRFGIEIWFFKVHGGPFQKSGIPDLVGVCRGLFFGFEIKEEDGGLSAIQIETILDIGEAGGLALAILTPQEAIDALEYALGRAKSRRRVCFETGSVSSVLRAAYRQDIHHDGRFRKAPKKQSRRRSSVPFEQPRQHLERSDRGKPSLAKRH